MNTTLSQLHPLKYMVADPEPEPVPSTWQSWITKWRFKIANTKPRHWTRSWVSFPCHLVAKLEDESPPIAMVMSQFHPSYHLVEPGSSTVLIPRHWTHSSFISINKSNNLGLGLPESLFMFLIKLLYAYLVSPKSFVFSYIIRVQKRQTHTNNYINVISIAHYIRYTQQWCWKEFLLTCATLWATWPMWSSPLNKCNSETTVLFTVAKQQTSTTPDGRRLPIP